MDIEDIAKQYCEDSCREVCEHYLPEGTRIVVEEAATQFGHYASSIGFGDTHFHGSLVILANESGIRALGNAPISDPMDWLGELNNQIVGRFKNKMVRHGIKIQMGTPVLISGDKYDITTRQKYSKTLLINSNEFLFCTIFNLHIHHALEWQNEIDMEVAEEGSLSLF